MKQPQIKAICFDMWGTLCTGGKGDEWQILYETLADKTLDPEIFRKKGEEKFFTESLKIDIALIQLIKKLRIKTNQNNINSAIKFWKSLVKKSKIFPETELTMQKLAEMGPRLFIISNTDSEPFYKKISETGLKKYFEKFFLSSELGLLKPDKKIFEIVQQYLGLPKKQILMVDDSLYHGVIPARKFGWQALWVARGEEGDDPNRIENLTKVFNFL